jgi:hypothetical protein
MWTSGDGWLRCAEENVLVYAANNSPKTAPKIRQYLYRQDIGQSGFGRQMSWLV